MTTTQHSRAAFHFRSFDGALLTQAMTGRDTLAPAEGDMAHAKGTRPEEIEQNRQSFLQELGLAPEALTLGRQVHSNGVAIVTLADRGRGRYPAFDGFPETDGLITCEPGIPLGTIIADCVPILLYDPDHHAIGLVHSGWRGTVAGIVQVAVAEMTSEFGTDPTSIIAGVGPSIGGCCYEVGDEVVEQWLDAQPELGPEAVDYGATRPHLDLWVANRINLEQAGVRSAAIEIAETCTWCGDLPMFSHRAAMAGERPRGRMMMVAQLHER